MTKQNLQYDLAELFFQRGLDKNTKSWTNYVDSKTKSDVEAALTTRPGFYSFEKLAALISHAAEDYLEQMAMQAQSLTIQRFGRTIKLYAPLYLSNYCVNKCTYCGFNHSNKFEYKKLSIEEAVKDADLIAAEGFKDLLLVSSEDRKHVTVEYLEELAGRLRNKFSSLSVEIYQLNKEQYQTLFNAGIEGVTLYQETYDRDIYAQYHKGGPKSDYDNRLAATDDIASAGIREIGIGALLGLNDWRHEALALAEHAHYLMKKYWQSRVSISFPRLRPAYEVGKDEFRHLLSDKELVQMILAMRLCFADAGLVLSTRENATFRDNLIGLGITRMSAGSRTNPGGYSDNECSVGQFDVNDDRTPKEICDLIVKKGFEPVWKDWDKSFIG